jgi:Skp family chaperone for outer membrane proteins
MSGSSRRRALTIGIAMSGLASAFRRAWGQTSTTKEEFRLQTGRVTTVGSVDLEEVFEQWQKVPGQRQKLVPEIEQRMAELERAREKGKVILSKLHVLRPGTSEYDRTQKEHERIKDEVSDLQRKFQDELTHLETAGLADLLREVRIAVAEVARRRGLSFVVRAISPYRRIAVEAGAVKEAIASPLLYTDTATDITGEVLAVLNGKQ